MEHLMRINAHGAGAEARKSERPASWALGSVR